MMASNMSWPDNKRFAFTVFDDTDLATMDNVAGVYSFLRDCELRTTKSCWPIAGDPQKGSFPGQTCEDADYLHWLQELQADGFEIAWHGATWHGVPREPLHAAMEKFAKLFHGYPTCAANHSEGEGLYWGEHRLSGWRVPLHNLLTRRRAANQYFGHVEGNQYFWGDLCKKRIKYFRNFVFQDINTLKSCPYMPYHDTKRPYVNHWFASSNGNNVRSFNKCISEKNQDRLEREGGACIMYTHFANGFADGKQLDPTFTKLIKRLSEKNGWFVPVKKLLDHLLKVNGRHEITDVQRRRLERKWLLEKIFIGTN